MEFLLNMDRRWRIGLLYSLAMLSLIGLIITGNGWFCFIVLFFIGLLIYTSNKHSVYSIKKQEEIFNNSLKESSISPDRYFIGDDWLSGIAINNNLKKMIIMKRKSVNEKYVNNVLNFTDIIESELIENGSTVTKTSRGSQLGGAVVGSVLAGSVGGIVGGLSGQKISEEHCNRLQLKVVVDSLDCPTYTVDFIVPANNSYDKRGLIYKRIYEEVYDWHKLISVIIKRNELNTKNI